MAADSSNGNHQTKTKPPPLPSPLRFSKFFQSNMRILITGGAGFIGSHLVDRLMENEKNEIIVADNYFTGSKDNLKKWIGHPRFELIRHDVTEPLLVEVDQIYHLACPASPIFYKYNPVKTIKTNVIGTLNMLGLAKRVGARILLTSTSEVYGDPLEHPQPETYWGNVNPIGVRSCYDEGKRVAETLMFDYHRQHGLEIRIARIFNTYGPRMNIDDGRVVSNFIAQALRGEPLTVQAPGTQTRSFCYVSDLVDGLIRLMEGQNTGPINLGNPGEFTMLELAETVKELIKPDVEIKMVENTPDDPRQRKPDITKAKEVLGWEPKVKLRDDANVWIGIRLGCIARETVASSQGLVSDFIRNHQSSANLDAFSQAIEKKLQRNCVINLLLALANSSQRRNLLQELFADIALEVDDRAKGLTQYVSFAFKVHSILRLRSKNWELLETFYSFPKCFLYGSPTDIFVIELIDQLQKLKEEPVLLHYPSKIKVLQELRMTTTRLEVCLYSFASPGSPMYPARAVCHAAWESLDILYPVGRYPRHLISLFFRLLYPWYWPSSCWNFVVFCFKPIFYSLLKFIFSSWGKLAKPKSS
ncbi:hypothetical protein L6164_019188 [Bauhinia variegata]|uniref:Uncharacterized protein n=1 Tax=Bauhinia variegata TaxID=167791 RepID=A0ACB9NIH8_BAUVA|nr:hypothetical protein L6164_019188 [Bauhinia variegata]